jgi:putative colanic acid biosynthesis acetyltransferase WcaF
MVFHNKVDLSSYTASYKHPNTMYRLLWLLVSFIFFETVIPYPSKFKVAILRAFGGVIGRNVVIKPNVSIKYPCNLNIGNNTWIGERVWLDNLGTITIGSNVCISQGAHLLTGNHDFKKSTFDLITKPIDIFDGCWVGAYSTVTPGVTMFEQSILTVSSVATIDLNTNSIYQGNPACFKRHRVLVM